ncbi:MAG: sensor histidine kinase [Ruminococcus sp.]|nr:sensor histidine kinase [Ruminococcus sp.]
MKLSMYIKDNILSLIIFLITYFLIFIILIAFKVHSSIKYAITFLFFIMGMIIFLINYFRKRKFYNELINNVNILDKKYLVLETLSKPNFYEGLILWNTLYDINKDMGELVLTKENNVKDFKEYIEMWIHEVKIPIASLILLCHNHKNIPKELLKEVRKLDNYIDQVLYYVRSNYASGDFLIKDVYLNKVISNVAIKNKDDLLANKIDLIINVKKVRVYTDSKWLEFILNQIINNSIKYKDKDNAYIRIEVDEEIDKVVLWIIDNGMGIKSKDIKNVFKKCFTGENGRIRTKSTGMGLYIADKLCKKLGHQIDIESLEGEYTKLKITFGKNSIYKID